MHQIDKRSLQQTYWRIRIYFESKKMSLAKIGKEREKRDCWRCQVFIRENIIVSERRERGQKRCFSACAFYETTAARRRLSIGNDFRANVSETRSMINVIRGGRAAVSWEGEKENERGRERERQTRATRRKSRLKIAVFCSRRRSTFPDKRERERRLRSRRLRRKRLRLLPTRYPREAGMEDKGERWKMGK